MILGKSSRKIPNLSKETDLKEVFISKMLSLTSKRMIDIDQFITSEIGKIKKSDEVID